MNAVLVDLTAYLSKMFLVILAFLAPIKTMALLILVLCLIDLVTGVWAAKKRKEKITSAAMRRTVQKVLVYQAALLAGLLVQVLTGITGIPIINLIASLVGMTEGVSIMENLNSILGYNLFASLIVKLGKAKEKAEKVE